MTKQFNMFNKYGKCNKCGKPIYTQNYWGGVTSPIILYSCKCSHYHKIAIDYTNYKELPITYEY